MISFYDTGGRLPYESRFSVPVVAILIGGYSASEYCPHCFHSLVDIWRKTGTRSAGPEHRWDTSARAALSADVNTRPVEPCSGRAMWTGVHSRTLPPSTWLQVCCNVQPLTSCPARHPVVCTPGNGRPAFLCNSCWLHQTNLEIFVPVHSSFHDFITCTV